MQLVASQTMESRTTGYEKTFAPRSVNLDLPPALTHEIGLIVAHWSYLESQIDRVISYLLRLGPRAGPVAVFNLPLNSRLNIAHELIGRYGTVSNREFTALKHDILRTKAERDRIVESAWVWDANTRAHYPGVMAEDTPYADQNPNRSRAGQTTEPLTNQTARDIRRRVDYLNQCATGLFHAVVQALPGHIRLASMSDEISQDQDAGGGVKEYRRAAVG